MLQMSFQTCRTLFSWTAVNLQKGQNAPLKYSVVLAIYKWHYSLLMFWICVDSIVYVFCHLCFCANLTLTHFYYFFLSIFLVIYLNSILFHLVAMACLIIFYVYLFQFSLLTINYVFCLNKLLICCLVIFNKVVVVWLCRIRYNMCFISINNIHNKMHANKYIVNSENWTLKCYQSFNSYRFS